MRIGGRYIDEGGGKPLRRVDPIKDGKPNPEHNEYPRAAASKSDAAKPADKKEGK